MAAISLAAFAVPAKAESVRAAAGMMYTKWPNEIRRHSLLGNRSMRKRGRRSGDTSQKMVVKKMLVLLACIIMPDRM